MLTERYYDRFDFKFSDVQAFLTSPPSEFESQAEPENATHSLPALDLYTEDAFLSRAFKECAGMTRNKTDGCSSNPTTPAQYPYSECLERETTNVPPGKLKGKGEPIGADVWAPAWWGFLLVRDTLSCTGHPGPLHQAMLGGGVAKISNEVYKKEHAENAKT